MTPSTAQAAAHENLTTSFDFAHHESGPEIGKTHNDVRTITVNLPAGFTASNTAVPTCSDAQLLSIAGEGTTRVECPPASQVGTIGFEVGNGEGEGHPPAQFVVPLYNMEVTSFGVTAQLGFKSVIFTQILDVVVRPGDSGLSITTPNITKVEPRNISVTVWGLSRPHEHDAQRGLFCGNGTEVPPAYALQAGGFGGPQEAISRSSRSCRTRRAAARSPRAWKPTRGRNRTRSPRPRAKSAPIGECDRVPFDPTIEVQPTTESAESPTGLDVSLVVPQSWENPLTIATANLRDTRVTLPEGMTANPSLAAGLGACTPAQYESETSSSLPGEGCPAESKIGSIEIETPLLDEKIPGAIYIATPYDNAGIRHAGTPGRLAARAVCRREGPRAGDRHQSRGQDRTEPRHRPARHDVRKHAAAAVQQVHVEVPSRRDRAAGQPRDMRLLLRRRRPDVMVGARTAAAGQHPVRSQQWCPRRSLPVRWRAAVQPAGDRLPVARQRRRLQPVLSADHP